MEVTHVAEGLWRWTTTHPEWQEGQDWSPEVGCVYWEAEDAVVLIDPLVPVEEGERQRFLGALDRDVERHDRPVAILLTCPWHERSSAELAERYGVQVSAANPLPCGIEVIAVPSEKERVFWLEPQATVVVGDVLLGRDDGLELEPVSWLDSGSHEILTRELGPLLDLPVERVLTSHGMPVLAGGRAALERALGQVAA